MARRGEGGGRGFCNLLPGVISCPGGLRGKVFFHLLSSRSLCLTEPEREQTETSVATLSRLALENQRHCWLFIFVSTRPIFKLLSRFVSSKTVPNAAPNYRWVAGFRKVASDVTSGASPTCSSDNVASSGWRF